MGNSCIQHIRNDLPEGWLEDKTSVAGCIHPMREKGIGMAVMKKIGWLKKVYGSGSGQGCQAGNLLVVLASFLYVTVSSALFVADILRGSAIIISAP